MALNRNHAAAFQWDWGQDSDLTIVIYGFSTVWMQSDGDLFHCLGTNMLHDPLFFKSFRSQTLWQCTVKLERWYLNHSPCRSIDFSRGYFVICWRILWHVLTLTFWRTARYWCCISSICNQSASMRTDGAPSLQTFSCNLFQTNEPVQFLFCGPLKSLMSCHIALQNSMIKSR